MEFSASPSRAGEKFHENCAQVIHKRFPKCFRRRRAVFRFPEERQIIPYLYFFMQDD
jgi:hypothetical protein